MRGLTNAQPFVDTPGDANPPGAMMNMRPIQVGGRKRMGKRPHASRLTAVALGAGLAVQALRVVPKSVRQDIGPAAVVSSGTSKESGLFRGQCVLLDTDWTIRATFNDTRRDPAVAAPPTGPGGVGAFNCCWDPDNTDIGFFLTITKNTTLTTQDVYIVGINRIDASTGTTTHQAYAVDANPGYSTPLPGSGQGDLFPNEMHCHAGRLYIVAGTWVYVFDADDLTYLERRRQTWSDELQSIKGVTRNGIGYVLVLTTGASTISGPVVVDSSNPAEAFGQFVRSEVVLYRENTTEPISAYLTEIAMPQGTQNGDGAYELHRHFRFSEYSIQRPRGCIAYAMDVSEDGEYVYIGRTNQGFGYNPLANTSHRPNANGSPAISVAKIALSSLWTGISTLNVPSYIAPVTGSLSTYGFVWEVDTQSYRRTFMWNGGTYYCDIPRIVGGARDPGRDSDAPSIYALKADGDRIFCGGRRPSPSNAVPNVYCLRESDGAIMWSTDLRGLVQQNAIDVDPTSGNVVVGTNRVDGWDDNGTPSAVKAEVFELDRLTGAVRRSFDLTDAVNLNSYAATDAGYGAYDVAVSARGYVLVALAPYRYDT